MRKWFIKKLGGFSTTDEFIDIADKLNYKEKHKILTKAVKKSFNTIWEDDLFQQKNGVYYLEGKPITNEEVSIIKESAKHFMDSKLYKILERELRYQANKAMFTSARSEIDIIAGKMLLYYIKVIKDRLSKF